MRQRTDPLTHNQWYNKEHPEDLHVDFNADLAILAECTASPDPEVAFRGIGHIRRWLETAEEGAVFRARLDGWSWSRIGEGLGRSKQGLHQKYRHLDLEI